MKASYWDTSCVVALYTQEKLSPVIARVAEKASGPLVSSEILEIELTYALWNKELRREIRPGAASVLGRKFSTDVQAGRFLLAPLGPDIRQAAIRIAAIVHGTKPPQPLRTLDGIHLATAVNLGCPEMLTTDARMALAAKTLGLRVNPENTREQDS